MTGMVVSCKQLVSEGTKLREKEATQFGNASSELRFKDRLLFLNVCFSA